MQSGSQELRQYTRIVLGWWWLFVLCAAVSMAAAYYVTKATTPEYTSRVQVLVESSQQPGTPSQTDVVASESLAENYTDLITLGPTLQSVAANLPGDTYSPGALKRQITTSSLRNTITISVTDASPVMAATIANITAETFIAGLLDRQLSQLARFEEVLNEYGIEPDPELIANRAAGLDILSVVEPAAPAPLPSNDYLLRNVGIAGVLGLIVAGLGVFLIAYLDDKFRSAEALKTVVGLSLLGSIPRSKRITKPLANGDQRDIGHLAESFRFLWTNVGFASRDPGPVKTLLVTSPGISEGKTVTATNLAISAAGQGRSVILVDLDFRSPSLHDVFDLRDSRSFVEVLAGDATLDEALSATSVDGLRVVAGNGLVPEADIVLPPGELSKQVQELEKRADLVIFDSSPLLAVTDSIMVASMVDGVLLVVDSRKTRRNSVTQAVEALQQANAHLIGAVLNRVRDRKPAEEYLRHSVSRGKNHARTLPSLPIISGLVLGTVLLGLAVALLVLGFEVMGI